MNYLQWHNSYGLVGIFMVIFAINLSMTQPTFMCVKSLSALAALATIKNDLGPVLVTMQSSIIPPQEFVKRDSIPGEMAAKQGIVVNLANPHISGTMTACMCVCT